MVISPPPTNKTKFMDVLSHEINLLIGEIIVFFGGIDDASNFRKLLLGDSKSFIRLLHKVTSVSIDGSFVFCLFPF